MVRFSEQFALATSQAMLGLYSHSLVVYACRRKGRSANDVPYICYLARAWTIWAERGGWWDRWPFNAAEFACTGWRLTLFSTVTDFVDGINDKLFVVCLFQCYMLKVKRYTCTGISRRKVISEQRGVLCHVDCRITQLPVTGHKWTHPALTPARQAGTRFTYPGGMEGWVDLGGWVHTEMIYLSVCWL